MVKGLASNVHQLTMETTHKIETDNGPRFVKAPPLLDQLRVACKGISGSSSGGGSGTPAPLALSAYDLYLRIESVVFFQHGKFFPGVKHGSLEDSMKAWARVASVNDCPRKEAEQFTAEWVAAIEQVFQPAKPLVIDAPCPQCGELFHTAFEDDETRWKRCLTGHAFKGEAWVECGNCGSAWVGAEMHHLNAAIEAGRISA